jgi:hypothetical protein
LTVSFVIESWAACAPGLDAPQRWRDWAGAPWLPEGEPQVALAAVPPMLRRRFGPLGRLAAQVAFELADAAHDDDTPSVFASRHGESGRCLELLAHQARGEALSPTAFGLSVHNAIGAMVAIAQSDRSSASAIAAGRATAAAGVAEAVGLLADGAAAANLIVYDAPLPPAYAPFQDEPAAHFAWAWRVRAPRAGEPALHLEWRATPPADAVSAPAALPAALQALWFSLSGAPALDQALDGQWCRWSRDV